MNFMFDILMKLETDSSAKEYFKITLYFSRRFKHTFINLTSFLKKKSDYFAYLSEY